MHIAKLYRLLSLVCLFFLSGTSLLLAQGTDLGTIRGTVTDASGAVVPKARVVATDLAEGTDHPFATNADGTYEAFGLNPGNYVVKISAPGFAVVEIKGVTLSAGAIVNANAVLQPSQTQQTVEVTEEAPLVNTDDQTISETLNSRDVIDLPRDSRDVYDFLYLNPNITQSGEPGDFKFIGAQSYGASFSLDGQRSNGGIFGTATSSQPSLEGVQEIKVMSTDFSAEYAGIQNIRVTTKRGTAHYHGSLFYENENSALSAWTVQDKVNAANFAPTPFQSSYPKPFVNINDLGASFGGPIPKVKNTWFFTSYERDYNASPVTVGPVSTLANPQLWTGNFSNVLDADKPLVPAGITLTPQEIAQDTVGGLGQQFIQIPPRLLNPYVQKLISTYFPKIGTSAPINPVDGTIPDYETNLPSLGVQDLGTVRVDHDFSANDHVFTSLNIGNFDGEASPVSTPVTGLGLIQSTRRNYTLANSYTRVIRPNLINEVRGGFNWQNLLLHGNTTLQGFLSNLGFTQQQIAAYGAVVGQSQLPTYGNMAISINGYEGVGNGGRSIYRPENQNLMTFGDTVTWVVGRHNIRIGGDTVRNQADDGYPANRGNPRGRLNYDGQGTNSWADFLLGLPPDSVSYVDNPRPPMNVHNWENGYFVQDDFKVTPNLTLNLGFRYEVSTPFIDKNGLMVNFDPNFTDPTTGQVGRFIVPNVQAEQYLTPSIISYGVVTAAQSGLGIGPGLVHTDWSNWAPRVGFAWRLGSKNVIRGGWGVYYDTSAAQGIRDALESAGFNQGATARSTASSPLTGWPSSSSDAFSPISGGAVAGFGNTPSVNIIDFNLRNPRIQQYNVTFERDLGWQTALRFSYLGSWMTGLIEGHDLQEIPPNNIPFGTTQGDGVTICDPYQGDCAYSPEDMARMRFPNLGDFVMDYQNIGHGYSNAFQAQVEHRFSSGLQFLANYTYLDQIVTTPDTDNSSLGGELYDPFSSAVETGQDAFVSHNRFIAYGVYDLPVGRDRKFGSHMSKWLDTAIGGWQTTFNMFIKSGDFFTPYWVCTDCDPVIPGNIISGAIDAVEDFGSPPSFRPTILSNNYNQASGDQIWNPAAFGLPSIGSDLFSNPAAAPRNLLEGPGAWGLNLGVHKNFRLGEHVTAMLGADADNLLNHPIFMPDQNYAGGGGPFAMLGTFNIAVNQTTGALLPITDVTPNPLFGVKTQTFMQEAVAGSRQFRLRLRITW